VNVPQVAGRGSAIRRLRRGALGAERLEHEKDLDVPCHHRRRSRFDFTLGTSRQLTWRHQRPSSRGRRATVRPAEIRAQPRSKLTHSGRGVKPTCGGKVTHTLHAWEKTKMAPRWRRAPRVLAQGAHDQVRTRRETSRSRLQTRDGVDTDSLSLRAWVASYRRVGPECRDLRMHPVASMHHDILVTTDFNGDVILI
jgi:hypothetical protein